MKNGWARGIKRVLILGLALVNCACATTAVPIASRDSHTLKIGFSQMEMTNPWRIAETQSMQQCANDYGAELLLRDADSSVEQQVRDCLELLALPVDYLVLAPRLDRGYQEVFDAAKQVCVPVILVDRFTEGEEGKDYVCSITADFAKEGQACARRLASEFNGKPCKIIELTGTDGSSVAKIRSEAFRKEVAKHPNMCIVYSASGDFVRTTAQTTMENILQTFGEDFNAIFAHDDDSGIGAIQALKGAGRLPGKDVVVVSIAGQKDALKAIIAGELLASVECDPRLGTYVFDTIDALQNSRDYPSHIVYSGIIYDAENAKENFGRAF